MMAEDTPTPTPPPDTASEDTTGWTVTYETAGRTIEIPVTAEGIRDEIRDQASVKGSNRKGVLRSTRRKLQQAMKKDLASLSPAEREGLEWHAFILLINDVIANRHVAIRENPATVEEIANDPRLQPPGDQAS